MLVCATGYNCPISVVIQLQYLLLIKPHLTKHFLLPKMGWMLKRADLWFAYVCGGYVPCVFVC